MKFRLATPKPVSANTPTPAPTPTVGVAQLPLHPKSLSYNHSTPRPHPPVLNPSPPQPSPYTPPPPTPPPPHALLKTTRPLPAGPRGHPLPRARLGLHAARREPRGGDLRRAVRIGQPVGQVVGRDVPGDHPLPGGAAAVSRHHPAGDLPPARRPDHGRFHRVRPGRGGVLQRTEVPVRLHAVGPVPVRLGPPAEDGSASSPTQANRRSRRPTAAGSARSTSRPTRNCFACSGST